MRGHLKKIDSPVYVKRLFFLCWLAYCVSYLGRLNYSAAMTVMIQERVLDTEQAGFISMLYFLTYGIGQLLNGFLSDRSNPKWMILIGIAGSAVANITMGVADNFWQMAFIWGINGYIQSMVWAPIIRIFAEMMTEDDKMRSSVNIASSSVVGTLLSYFVSALLLAVFPWKVVFFIPAVLLFLTGVIFKAGFQSVLDFADSNFNTASIRMQHQEVNHTDNKKERKIAFKQLFLCSELLFIVIPVVIHGVLKDGVTAWVPTYISSGFNLAPSFSVLLTMVLPVVNLAGAYIGWEVYKRLKKNIFRSNLVFFAGAAVSLLLLFVFGRYSAILTVALLAVITSAMMAVNTLMISIYPLKFEKLGRVSSVSGFLNAMAYTGSAISTFGIGLIAKYKGWQVTIFTWFAVTLSAMVFCFLTMKKWKEKR